MRLFIAGLLIIFLLSNCKKERDGAGSCRLKETSLYNGTTFAKSYTYTYDGAGRIVRITELSPSVITDFTYYPDSVVALSARDKRVYFLKNGRADSLSLIYLNHPFNPKYFYKYQYNAEGYLLSERQIFTEVANGQTALDTTWIDYTISNGNLIKAVQSPGDEITFEYTNQLRPLNNPDLPVESSKFSFLGRPSKNLPAKTSVTGGASYTMTYEYDGKGNISKYIATYAGPGPVYTFNYSYSCE